MSDDWWVMVGDLSISIITPSFNRADELGHLFQSLENQSTDPASFESIISDDGSTDGTEALVKRMNTCWNAGEKIAI